MEEPIYEDTEIEFKGDEMFGVGFDPEIWFYYLLYLHIHFKNLMNKI